MKKHCIESPEKELPEKELSTNTRNHLKYNGLLALPSDTIENIMLFLDFPDFCQLAYVCKYYSSLQSSLQSKNNKPSIRNVIWQQQYQNMRQEIAALGPEYRKSARHWWKIGEKKCKWRWMLLPDMMFFEKDLLQSSKFNFGYFDKMKILYCNIELLIFDLKKQLQYFKGWWINNYNLTESITEFENIDYGCCCHFMNESQYNRSICESANWFLNENLEPRPHCIYRDGNGCCLKACIYSEDLRVCFCIDHFELYKMRKLRLNFAKHYGDNNNDNAKNCDKCCCRYYSPIYDSSSLLRFKHRHSPPVVNEFDKYIKSIFYRDIYNIIISYLRVDARLDKESYFSYLSDNREYKICEHCGTFGAQIYFPASFPFLITLHPLYSDDGGRRGSIYLCDGNCAWNFMLDYINYHKIDRTEKLQSEILKYIPIPCVKLRHYKNAMYFMNDKLSSLYKSSPLVLTEKCVIIDRSDTFNYDETSTVHRIHSLTHQDYCDGEGCWTYLPKSYIL